MLRTVSCFCIIFILALSLLSCSKIVESTIDRAAEVTGAKVGERIGETVGTAVAGYAEASLRNLSPALMQLYVSTIFSAFFYSGGYHFDHHDYDPGEWSRWKGTGMEEGDQFEKAFLKKTADGQEWWQISVTGVREGTTEEVILEALFSPPNEAGVRNLLRLRSLFPEEKMPSEIPVQENTAAWYHDPIKVTQESLEAATTGVENVTTPAGTFKARHVVFRDVSGVAEWWLNSDVPGNIVKYQITNSGEAEPRHIVELMASGTEAKSRLQSF